MTMHSLHEDMPADAVLADDCDRCEQHASDPFRALDDSHLARIGAIAQGYMDTGKFKTVTTNDYVAASKVVEIMNFYNRLVHVCTNATKTHI